MESSFILLLNEDFLEDDSCPSTASSTREMIKRGQPLKIVKDEQLNSLDGRLSTMFLRLTATCLEDFN